MLSPLFTKLYETILARLASASRAQEWRTRILILLRRKIARVCDPFVELPVQGHTLLLPFSHDLPIYAATLPFYNMMLARLAHFLAARRGGLAMIDVGANIGDTVMLCADAPDARFLCVEADPKFAPILRHNLTGVNAVFIHSLCGARDETVGVVRQNQEGTAIFAPAGSAGAGEQVAFRRLDSIIDEHPDFAAAHLLKIDTDGYDFDVLRGATRMLARRPAVFFEAAPFGRKSYLTEVGAIFDLLRTSGYTQVLLYDNYGLPFGRYRLADEAAWTDALRYQVFSGRIFYDILAMGDPDFDEFAATEYGFFDTKHASQMAPSAT